MCDGGVISVPLAMAVVSAATTMYSQRRQEKSAEKAAEYNAQMAENEAAIERQNAKNIQAKSAADTERQQRDADRRMGQMRANMAAGGFEIDSGSNLNLLAETASELQYEIAIDQSNAKQAAWNHENAALAATNQMNFAKWQGDQAKSGRGVAALEIGNSMLGAVGAGMSGMNTKAPTFGGGINKNTAPKFNTVKAF